MRRFLLLFEAIFMAMAVFYTGLASAQTLGKRSLSQALVIYPGDSDQTINRRARWIEGAKKEGALEWWSSESPDKVNKILSEFNKVYPFIKGSYWIGQGRTMAPKIDLECASGHFTVDVMQGGQQPDYPRWRKIGLLDNITENILRTQMQNIDKRMYSRYGDWIQLGNNPKVPIVNTKLISRDDLPKNWEDLLNPRFKGQIGLQNEMVVWYTLAIAEGGWGIQKTEEFLKKLKQQKPIWVSGNDQGRALLTAGEFKIFGADTLRFTLGLQKKGAPVDWIKVRPIPTTGASFILHKKAPHPNAARLFIEWLYSHEGLTVFEKITGTSEEAKALEGVPLVLRTEELALKAIELDLEKRFADILGVTK